MPAASELVFQIPDDIEQVLDSGAQNLPENSRVVFTPDSVLRLVGTNAVGLAHIHDLGLRHAANCHISDTAIRNGAEDTWRRYRDSSYLIARIATAHNARDAAQTIYNIHRNLMGTDIDGIEKSALDPVSFANAHVRNWQHSDTSAEMLGLSIGDREQQALEELVRFQLIGVDTSHFPVGRDALLARATELEAYPYVQQTPLLTKLLDRTEPPAKLGEIMDTAPWPIDKALDIVLAGPVHSRLTDAALVNMPAATLNAMRVDIDNWSRLRKLTARNTRDALNRVATYLGTHDSPYLRTHPDLVVDMYGEPTTELERRQHAASRAITNALAGNPGYIRTAKPEDVTNVLST